MTTTAVTKHMSMDDLREKLAQAEGLETTIFEPQSGNGSFALNGEGKVRWQFRKSDGTTDEFRVKPDAYLKLGQMLGIPQAYAQKTPQFMMVPHMNYWLTQSRLPQLGFANIDDTIQLFSRGDMEVASNYKILDVVEEVKGRELNVHHVSNDLFNTTFSIVTGEEREVAEVINEARQRAAGDRHARVNDVVHTGVCVENSYAAASPLTLSAYVHRLVCTNGAISVQNVYRLSRRAGDGMDAWLREAVTDVFNAADAEVQQLREMREVRLDRHMSDAMASIFQNFGVPHQVRQDIMDLVVDRQVDNLYDLYNTVTEVASNNPDVLLDANMSRRIMRIGGQVAAHREFCAACHQVRR